MCVYVTYIYIYTYMSLFIQILHSFKQLLIYICIQYTYLHVCVHVCLKNYLYVKVCFEVSDTTAIPENGTAVPLINEAPTVCSASTGTPDTKLYS